MGLQAEPPTRVRLAVFHAQPGILLELRTVLRLQEEIAEVQVREELRPRLLLGINQLQLVSRVKDQLRAFLRTEADLVQTGRRGPGSVGLDGHLEPAGVKLPYQVRVQLQQRLAAGADHERTDVPA